MIVTLGFIALTSTVAVLFMYQQKRIQALHDNLGKLALTIQKYQTEQSALVNADLVFAKQMAEINRQLISIENQLQSQVNKRDNDGGYQHALKILEMGGDKTEIVDSCHLSNAEAELLMNLHAYRKVIKVVQD